jgi:nitrogen fixation/metabolism regulation signal transduction histidine kinase
MRFSILSKILLAMLVVSVIPLSIVGYIALSDAKEISYNTLSSSEKMGNDALKMANELGYDILDDSVNALNNLGANLIELTAKSVAKELEIYIKAHPKMTVKDLQKDQYFQSIAVQPVGKKGYTAVTDVNSLICRFHKSPKVANLDLHKLAKPYPGFWGIMAKTEGGTEAEGYYDWPDDPKDPNSPVRKKFMYIAIVNTTTADGVKFSVAATTYLEEFNKPMEDTKKKIEQKIDKVEANIQKSIKDTKAEIKRKTEGVKTDNKIALVTILAIIAVILIGLFLGKMITIPIKKLTLVANKVNEGDLSAKVDVMSKDEIMDLAAAIEALTGSVKYLRQKADKLEKVNKRYTEIFNKLKSKTTKKKKK